MMIILVTIFIGVICTIEYMITKKQICSPSVLFSFPFFLMLIVASLNVREWELDTIGVNTCLVLIIGILSFNVSATFFRRVKITSNRRTEILEPNVNANITFAHLIISLIIESIAFLLYSFYLLKWGSSQGVFSISDAINLSMIRGKFSSGSSLNLPFYVNSIIICSMAFGYTYCTILAKNIVYKRKGYNKLLAINVIIPIFITILSGSRGSSLEVIVVFAVSILFYYYKKYNWKKTLDFKYFILCVLLLLLIMYAFFAIKGVMGRGAFDPSKYYDEFCIYLGSQVKNLDIYLNKDMYHTNVFAYSTLRDFYNIFNSYLGFNIKDSVKLLPFQIINGKELGNVYTCFYNYFMDFGYLGVVFFSSISGCVSEYVYKKAKISSNKSIDIWLIIYAYIAASLVFCFFGSRFYSNLMSAGFIRLLIWSFLIKIYLTRVKIFQNKKKVGK